VDGPLPGRLREERVGGAVRLAVPAPEQRGRERALAARPVMDRGRRAMRVAGLEGLRLLEVAVGDLRRPAPAQTELEAPRERIGRAPVDVPSVLVGLLAVEGGIPPR
jgi:hypothetical protein